MKISLERKTVKTNSKSKKRSRLTTPVSSKKTESKEIESKGTSRVVGRI
jgi:hypothetical protein